MGKSKMIDSCINFRHFLISLLIVILVKSAFATGVNLKKDDLTPMKDDSFASKIFLKDKSGILNTMILERNEIVRREEIAENHGLQNNPYYRPQTSQDEFEYASKRFLRFTEKRIIHGHQLSAEEKKKKKKGNKLDEVEPISKFAKSLEGSSSDIKMSDTKIRFKINPLKGRGGITLNRGSFRSELKLKLSGDIDLNMVQIFKGIGLSIGNTVDIKDQDYKVYVNKTLTKFTVAKISSKQHQYSDSPLSKEAEKRVEVIFSQPF